MVLLAVIMANDFSAGPKRNPLTCGTECGHNTQVDRASTRNEMLGGFKLFQF